MQHNAALHYNYPMSPLPLSVEYRYQNLESSYLYLHFSQIMFTLGTRQITVLSKRFHPGPATLNRLGPPLRQNRRKCHSVNYWVQLLCHSVFGDIKQVIKALIEEITMRADDSILHRFACTIVEFIMKLGLWDIAHLPKHFPVCKKLRYCTSNWEVGEQQLFYWDPKWLGCHPKE